MTTHQTRGVGYEQIVSLVEGLCSLPAVATPSWADQAAQTLTRAHSKSLTSVLVGQIAASGAMEHLETAGAAASASLPDGASSALSVRSNIERLDDLGIELGAITARGVRAEDAMGPAWSRRGIGSAWPAGACDALIIGSHPIGPRELGRHIVVGIGLMGSADASETARVADLLASVLPLLARRVLLAIGAKVSGPSRWLTDREQAVLERLALGLSVREIAEDIGRSPHTVHDHVKSLHRKLGASSRGELVARALGYIDDAHRVLGTLAGSMVEPKPDRAAKPGSTIVEAKPGAATRLER
ncbi:MAG: helix-turn-helix transcriptional regulator [Phycisphaerales bacterium]